MTLSSKSLAGPGYIILNAIRGMNIVGLLTVVCASVIMLVKTVTLSNFFFFDAVSHIVTAIVSIFLIVSECSLFRSYFVRNWPLLSPTHGFVTLGIAMIVLGLNILGNLNKDVIGQKDLGLAFWRIIIGSGIVVFILGFFNILASYVFRDPSLHVTARHVRAKGAVAVRGHKTHSATVSTSSVQQTPIPVTPSKPASNPFRFLSRRDRQSTLPSYHSASPTSSPTSKYSRGTRESVGPRIPINISAPIGVNPQFAHLKQAVDGLRMATKMGVENGQSLLRENTFGHALGSMDSGGFNPSLCRDHLLRPSPSLCFSWPVLTNTVRFPTSVQSLEDIETKSGYIPRLEI